MHRFRLVIPDDLVETMLAHARTEFPNECCGFLAGTRQRDIGRVSQVHTLINELSSPTAFRTEPRSLFAAFKAMRRDATELLAIYHSHPESAPVPSRRDLAENTYGGGIPWLIFGFVNRSPEIAVWWLDTDSYSPATWSRVDHSASE